jgi:hypothetical protein
MTDLSQQNQWTAVLGRECTSENIFPTPQISRVRTPNCDDSTFNSRSGGPYVAQGPQRPMRAKPNLLKRFNLICLSIPSRLHVISDFQKLFLTLDPNHLLILRHPVPREGTLAIVTDVGAGSGGREGCD